MAKRSKTEKFIDKGIAIGSQIADVAIHIGTSPAPVAALAVAAKGLAAYRKVMEVQVDDYFEDWERLNGVNAFNAIERVEHLVARHALVSKLMNTEGEDEAPSSGKKKARTARKAEHPTVG